MLLITGVMSPSQEDLQEQVIWSITLITFRSTSFLKSGRERLSFIYFPLYSYQNVKWVFKQIFVSDLGYFLNAALFHKSCLYQL